MTYDRSVVFSGTPVSSTNKTDRQVITDLLLEVALNTINQTIMLHGCLRLYFQYCIHKWMVYSQVSLIDSLYNTIEDPVIKRGGLGSH